ncbi:MAG: prolyl oligopeptidase family serine peptidase [Bacteriovorax sp.]
METMKPFIFLITYLICTGLTAAENLLRHPEVVYFKSGDLTLGGELFKPTGSGPFPAILWNHGSAPGMLNSQASKIIGPLFTAQGWIFFMPYRRGQGLSSQSGVYIGDEITKAGKSGTEKAAASTMIRLLKGEQLDDQIAALNWLKGQKFVQAKIIAVAGNSFGGIETILGAARETYCAAVDASGGAESWAKASELQILMKDSVRNSKSPILFFQAENDYDLSPSKTLSLEMKSIGKISEMKIYPTFGKSNKDGHSFAYLGSSIWFNDVFKFIREHCEPNAQ